MLDQSKNSTKVKLGELINLWVSMVEGIVPRVCDPIIAISSLTTVSHFTMYQDFTESTIWSYIFR